MDFQGDFISENMRIFSHGIGLDDRDESMTLGEMRVYIEIIYNNRD